MLPERFDVIVKTFQGLEEVLASEIRQLDVQDIQILNRAVRFNGDMKSLYQANYLLRSALKVLVEIDSFEAQNEVELYQQLQQIDWLKYLDPSNSIAVECVLNSDNFTHSQFIALRTKDAIVDQSKAKTGKRPKVDREKPDLKISLHIVETRVGVLIDSSGDPLYKRGYRFEQYQAPVNEVLAAGMLLLSGYNGNGHLVDPMCGSGTFIIEAAMIAYNLPPGMYRKSFGFEKWKNFDEDLFETIMDEVEEKNESKFRIIGSDTSSKALLLARQSLKAAFLDKKVELQQVPVQEFVPPKGGGYMITNPPYGERIKIRDIQGFYKMLGDRLKNNYLGYQAWVFSGNLEAMKSLGLHPTRKISLLNGSIPCTFRRFEIYEGSKKAKYQNRRPPRKGPPQGRDSRPRKGPPRNR